MYMTISPHTFTGNTLALCSVPARLTYLARNMNRKWLILITKFVIRMLICGSALSHCRGHHNVDGANVLM